MRERLFNLRMSDDEFARLEAIASHYGINGAGVVRMLLKREVDALGIQISTPSPKPTPAETKK